jgi:hypothetical protein
MCDLAAALTHPQLAVRALSTAQETFLRMNDQGMLCVNHKIVSDDGKGCYVCFTILPDEQDAELE